MSNGWIGFDLDGTLAKYDGWQGNNNIGDPILPILDLLLGFLAKGQEVRIMTARVSSMNPNREEARKAIELWCFVHIGVVIPVTAEKDFEMIDLYDDRCHHVEANTGRILG